MTLKDILLTAGLIIAGIFVTMVGIMNVARARASRKWPKATATISGHRTTSSGSSATIWADYGYSVGGKDYKSSLSRPLSGEGAEQEFKAQYPVGGTIQVAYRPDKPEAAEADEDRRYNLVVVLAGLFFAVKAAITGAP